MLDSIFSSISGKSKMNDRMVYTNLEKPRIDSNKENREVKIIFFVSIKVCTPSWWQNVVYCLAYGYVKIHYIFLAFSHQLWLPEKDQRIFINLHSYALLYQPHFHILRIHHDACGSKWRSQSMNSGHFFCKSESKTSNI